MSKTPFREVRPTYQQEQALLVARTAFMLQAPFFASLYHDIGREVITRDIPTAATDGRHIAVNPDFFAGLTTPEQVFILAHEVWHMVGRHVQRVKSYQKADRIKSRPFDQHFANVCADYVINADLVATGIGAINPEWLLHPGVSGDEIWEDVYERLWQDKPTTQPPPPPPPPPPDGPRDKPGNSGSSNDSISSGSPVGDAGASEAGKCAHIPWTPSDHKRVTTKPDQQAKANGGTFDRLLDPPVNPVTGEDELPGEHEFKEAVARAAAVAKAQGKLPASMQRMVGELLAPQVNWREHIRQLITGKIGYRGETWTRPNRRRLALNPIVVMPGRNGYGCQTVVIAVDTSGSIGGTELDVFFAEIGGVLNDVRPRRIVVVGCDAEVSQVDEVTSLDEFEGLRAKGVKGGGGTDFRPVFDHVGENDLRPEALIYCTDLLGSFPQEAPAYPVIWCSTSKGKKAPFGDLVEIAV